jgi:hypothetical protein
VRAVFRVLQLHTHKNGCIVILISLAANNGKQGTAGRREGKKSGAVEWIKICPDEKAIGSTNPRKHAFCPRGERYACDREVCVIVVLGEQGWATLVVFPVKLFCPGRVISYKCPQKAPCGLFTYYKYC